MRMLGICLSGDMKTRDASRIFSDHSRIEAPDGPPLNVPQQLHFVEQKKRRRSTVCPVVSFPLNFVEQKKNIYTYI